MTGRHVESYRFPLAHRASPLTLQFRAESDRAKAERSAGERAEIARMLARLLYNRLPGWLVAGLCGELEKSLAGSVDMARFAGGQDNEPPSEEEEGDP